MHSCACATGSDAQHHTQASQRVDTLWGKWNSPMLCLAPVYPCPLFCGDLKAWIGTCLGDVLALRPCPASNGVQFIAELKVVLCANAIAGRKSFMFLYCESSHFVRQPLRCCINLSTTTLDRWLCDPVVICLMPRYQIIAATTPLTNSERNTLLQD